MRVSVIAEVGINFQASVAVAIDTMRAAHAAGADVVKFQKRTVALAVPPTMKDTPRKTPWGSMRYEDYKNRMEIDPKGYALIASAAREIGITWTASAFDPPSVAFLAKRRVPWIKLPSAGITDTETLNAARDTGIPIVLSTGGASWAEIDRAVDALSGSRLTLLHCCSRYPHTPEHARLLVLDELRQRYGLPVGYCVVPETRVLRADLRWVPAGDLSVGDELVAFDEALDKNCKMRRATVTGSRLLELPCYEIVTDRGTVVSSDCHRFVVSRFKGRPLSPGGHRGGQWTSTWIEAKGVRVGDKIRHFVSPWGEETSYEAGWLAGMFDGEGWISGRRACVAQNPGPLLDRLERTLKERGFKVSPRRQNKERRCMTMEIAGRRESMRFLGSIRPTRLLDKSPMLWDGVRAWSADSQATVISVRQVGVREVVGLTTSTGTLITEGLMSHNSGHEEPGTCEVTLGAVARGAVMVERHLTLSRHMWGSDHGASLEPSEFAAMVRQVRRLSDALTSGSERAVSEDERAKIETMRRSSWQKVGT